MPHRLHAQERARQVRGVLRTVLWLNVAVVGIKLVVFAKTHALSVAAEVFHSGLDATNNVFALALARVAARVPDAEHPYGHHKFETLGALALVGVLSVTVFELAQRAVGRLTAPPARLPQVDGVTLALLGVGLVAGIAITRYESRAGRRLGSDLLLADAAHTRADVLTTVAVLIGLVAVRYGVHLADPIATLLVAAIVAHTGWEIVRETVPVLVDSRAVPPTRIESTALAVEGVESAYGIRSRGRPGEVFAELTIAVHAGLDVARAHDIADAVEGAVRRDLDARNVAVHVEPYR